MCVFFLRVLGFGCFGLFSGVGLLLRVFRVSGGCWCFGGGF